LFGSPAWLPCFQNQAPNPTATPHTKATAIINIDR
jgi:hypothetical protein